jgi:hypothetical protein
MISPPALELPLESIQIELELPRIGRSIHSQTTTTTVATVRRLMELGIVVRNALLRAAPM